MYHEHKATLKLNHFQDQEIMEPLILLKPLWQQWKTHAASRYDQKSSMHTAAGVTIPYENIR